MQTVDEQLETLHIYVVREEAPKPQLFPIVLSVLALLVLVALAVVVPYQQPVTRLTIRVQAVPLAIRTFTAQVRVIPSGIKAYPSTTAHGVLTITNGSIIGQSIPAGFTVQGIVTDNAVFVPPGNANGYGWAQVEAHTVAAGQVANLPPYTINSVIGSSVYIRNLSAFHGGRDSYSVTYATAQDRKTALVKTRERLSVNSTGLHYPCIESIKAAFLMWRCQFITYQLPAFLHVSAIQLIGKNLIIAVWFVAHPRPGWVK